MDALPVIPLFERYMTMTKSEQAEHDRMIDMRLEEQLRFNKERAFLNCGIPDEYMQCSFNNFDIAVSEEAKEARYAMSEFTYASGNKRIVALLGTNGTGKTHLAAAALRELGGLYKHSFDLCSEFEDTKNFRNQLGKVDVLKKYAGCSFLVIDEAGRSPDPNERLVLSKILTDRMESGKKTIIISNSTKQEFYALIDNATLDRMNVYGKIIELTGKSYRLFMAKNC